MDKDSWVMLMTILAAFIMMVILSSCSLIEVQVQTGKGSMNKAYDHFDREIHLMDEDDGK